MLLFNYFIMYNIGMSTEEILKEALSLTPSEKARMIEALLDSLDKSDQEIENIWNDEIEARLSAYIQGEIKAIPMEDVL